MRPLPLALPQTEHAVCVQEYLAKSLLTVHVPTVKMLPVTCHFIVALVYSPPVALVLATSRILKYSRS